MPRKPRLYLANTPQHIIVRGHNRSPILARLKDFRFMYQCVLKASQNHKLAIHAWVFMHNHLHLLATPENENSTPKTMQSIGRRYAQYFNASYGKTGSLWEGRYKSAWVDSERYLLCCYRYIELNPVRAGLAKTPDAYAYSSYHHNGLEKVDKLIAPHGVYLALCAAKKLDSSPTLERSHYRRLFDQTLSRKDITAIQRGTNKNAAIGSNQFQLKVAGLLSNL